MADDERFERMVNFVFQWEIERDAQGNVVAEDVAGDRGGVTKYGIDQASHPDVDIRNLTEEQAKEIYYREYYLASGADKLPDGIAEIVFDMAVNNGKGRAIKILQEAVGATVDGGLGPETLGKVEAAPREETIAKMLAAREQLYRNLAANRPGNQKFLAGWLNRNNALREFVGGGEPGETQIA
jgi:lysozyme family protein